MKRLKLIFALTLAFVLCLTSTSIAFAEQARSADGEDAASYPFNTTQAVADLSTSLNWTWLLQKDTANVSRIWPDKSVSTSSILFNDYEGVNAGGTYWYQHDFYKMEGDGSAALIHGSISFPGSAAEAFEGTIGYDANDAYFKAGAGRLLRIDDLHMDKEQNVTGTVEDVLNPKWNSTAVVSAATMVNVHLGSNGKLTVERPGTLEVSNQIQVPDGYALNDYANDEFEYTLTLPAAAGKTLAAGVVDGQGIAVAGGMASLAFDANGKASFKLKGSQVLRVYGIAAGSSYAVVETERAGWKLTGSSEKAGVISAAQTSVAKFVNTYSAKGHLGDNAFIGSKILTGREWTANDRFVFQLKAASVSPDAPLPQPDAAKGETVENGSAYVEVTEEPGFPAGDHVDFVFGDIAYTKPGTYTYEIWESEQASNILPGVSPSQALYRIVVTVVDEEHDGELTVTTEWKKLLDDGGKPVAKESQYETPGGAVFVNEYDTTTVKWNPSGTKFYDDTTGAFGFTRGMFNVALCTNDAAAPLPPEGSAESISTTIDGVPWRGVITTVEEGGSISFPRMTYDYDKLGHFEYKIVEVVKDASGNWAAAKDVPQGSSNTIPGMTYDPAVWTVGVDIVEENGVLVLKAKYAKDGVAQDGSTFSFSNRYNPTPAKVTVSGSKVLTGRDTIDGESFGFALAAVNDAAKSVLPLLEQAEVRGLSAGDECAFGFSELTFTKPGTYLFKLYENAYYSQTLPADGVSGIAFDRHECTVSVVVNDSGEGALRASIAYGGAGPIDNHPEQFVNSYFATTEAAGGVAASVVATTQLTGRPLAAGEFSFAIKYAAADGDVLTASNAADGTVSFAQMDYDTSMLADLVQRGCATKSTTADGKTQWTIPYVAYEKTSGLADAGITAQTQPIPFTVIVVDNANGALSATPNVGDGLEFKNAYAQGASASIGLAGVVGLSAPGLNPDDVTGKFTFTISSRDAAAPLPNPAMATNDKQGKVDFGVVEFTLGDLNNALNAAAREGVRQNAIAVQAGQPRSYTFVYAVTQSGSVPGVAMDAQASQAVYIRVTDSGAGVLSAERVDAQGNRLDASSPLFSFANTYSVAPKSSSVTDQIPVKVTLSGRELVAGEFAFELLEGGQVVATGTNDADGNVVLTPITYAGPGTHSYVLYQVVGQASFNGVTLNDGSLHLVTTVVDNGDGTLGVTHRLQDASTAVFENVYAPEESVAEHPRPVTDSAASNTVKKGEIAPTGDGVVLVLGGAFLVVVCAAALAAWAIYSLARRD